MLLFECAARHPAQIELTWSRMTGIRASSTEQSDSTTELYLPAQLEQRLSAERAPIRGVVSHSSHGSFTLEDQRGRRSSVERRRRELVHQPANAVNDDCTLVPLRLAESMPQVWVVGHGRLT